MGKMIVLIPTYNERPNLEQLTTAILKSLPTTDILIIDDGSPDGTGELAEELRRLNPHIFVLHRGKKAGLGRAYLAGFKWALAQPYQLIVTMDADFSHDPTYLPVLVDLAAQGAGIAVGSRYIRGGRITGWGWQRYLLSWTANWITRLVLGLKVHDVTAGYKCYRRDFLEQIDLDGVVSPGYAFQVEMITAAQELAAPVLETPVTFRDRTIGRSKVSRHELIGSAKSLVRLAIRRKGFREAGKFGLVGLLNVFVDLGLTNLFVAYTSQPRLSGYLATCVALVSSFLFNRGWTFSSTRQNAFGQFLRFIGVNGLGALINALIYTMLIDSIHYNAAKLVAIGAAATWNFLGTKYWVFGGERLRRYP